MSSCLTQTWVHVYNNPLQSICPWYVLKPCAHSFSSTLACNVTGCCWQANMSLLVLQLEAAARERVKRSERQEDEAQVPSDLQVFLHSTAQFGPASMRELMVGQRSCLPCFQVHACKQISIQCFRSLFQPATVHRPCIQSSDDHLPFGCSHLMSHSWS